MKQSGPPLSFPFNAFRTRVIGDNEKYFLEAAASLDCHRVHEEVPLNSAILSERQEELVMTQTVSVDEAQNKLQDLLADALAGNEVIITEHGTPVARLVPVMAQSKKKRVEGLNRGAILTSEDFD
jgi:prevent-host-death family protein